MIHRLLLVLVGVLLITIGLTEKGWLLLAAWMGANFLVLGIAHVVGAHRIFGKRADGSLPWWSRLVFLPLLLFNTAVWQGFRILSRKPPFHTVNDCLVIGRRLLPSEVSGQFDNYVDLTAEFTEPKAIRTSNAYQSVPILDGSAPDPDVLLQAISRLRPGRTFVHCAQGYGRTGLFALACLLKSGKAHSVDDGLAVLVAARPGIGLSGPQRRCIEDVAKRLTT
jgi:hypothetical protein